MTHRAFRARLAGCALGLALAVAPAAWASLSAPTQLGQTTDNGSISTTTITTGADAPPGSTIIIAMVTGNAATLTISDNASGGSNAYTVASTVCTFNTSSKIRVAYATVARDLPSGGVITFSWTGATHFAGAAVAEGNLANPPLDVQGACTSGTSTTGTPISPGIGTGTLGQASEIVFGIVGITSAFTAYASNSPFTTPNGGDLTGTTANNPNIQWGYDIVSATTGVTYAPQWNTSRAYGANVWTFKESTGSASNHNGLLLRGVGK